MWKGIWVAVDEGIKCAAYSCGSVWVDGSVLRRIYWYMAKVCS